MCYQKMNYSHLDYTILLQITIPTFPKHHYPRTLCNHENLIKFFLQNIIFHLGQPAVLNRPTLQGSYQSPSTQTFRVLSDELHSYMFRPLYDHFRPLKLYLLPRCSVVRLSSEPFGVTTKQVLYDTTKQTFRHVPRTIRSIILKILFKFQLFLRKS
jgi:hypothetical protein